MQIATMTTFPGPCRNVALLPDRGYIKHKKTGMGLQADKNKTRLLFLASLLTTQWLCC